MAGASGNGNQFNPHSYLSPNQQDLLLAALSSNMNGNKNQFSSSNPELTSMNGQVSQQFNGNTLDPSFFTSPQQNGSLSTFDAFNVDDSPYLDFADGDQNYDFDYDDSDSQMIGPLPGDEGDDIHDKRKSPEGGASAEPENGAKRQEGEDKQAKKPGRKPLTSEPTTKRKAQNRAAQRAFRERKEKHLKDLETKVGELEKQSEAEKHENGLLRAQVERLQTELREYRKRLSLNSGRNSGSPPVGGFPSYLASLANNQSTTNNNGNNFQFEFPRFGGLPGAHIFNNGSLGKQDNNAAATSKQPATNGLSGMAQAMRQDSNGRSVSPKSQLTGTGSAAQSPGKSSLSNSFDAPNGMFTGMTASSMPPEQGVARTSTDSSSSRSRVFQFNSGSTPSNSDSPSASSVSQFGNNTNSSCGTSPEPSHNSPSNKADSNLDTVNEKGYVCYGNSEGEIQFCEKLNMACGNPRNPVPRTMSSNGTPAPAATPAAAAAKTPAAVPDANSGIDFMANQNGGQFDPTLFGDYRESNAAIVGDGDFTGGFFNDAFPMEFGVGSPFNIGETPAIQKTNPMDEIEKLQDGGEDDEVVPGDDMSQMLSCHNIWDKLQSNPDFKEGQFDIDGLCSELRAKARCSESGVVVDQKDVDEALKRLPNAQQV